MRKTPKLATTTIQHITQIFHALDYTALGRIYCDEGGEAFWHDRREPCQKLGTTIAKALKPRLLPQGRSLYVGAGVPEIPILVMEHLEFDRTVLPYNLRREEVDLLNTATEEKGFVFLHGSAELAEGPFDHLWIVSVLNDPEHFPQVSELSYGRANPLHFDPLAFTQEREVGVRLLASCMAKLTRPGLVTTSVEEIPWIVNWCHTHQISYKIDDRTYPTALVRDPVCSIQIK